MENKFSVMVQKAQRKHSCFPPSSPEIEMPAPLFSTVLRLNPSSAKVGFHKCSERGCPELRSLIRIMIGIVEKNIAKVLHQY